MNSELQAQTNVLTDAIRDAASTAHHDMGLAVAVVGTLLVVLIVIVLFKKS